VRFPAAVTQRAVDRMRHDFTLADRQGVAMPVRFSEVHFSTSPIRVRRDFTANAGGFQPYLLDLDGHRRRRLSDPGRAPAAVAPARRAQVEALL
jgi:hypothetical protein